MALLSKGATEQERDEQLKILATNLEIMNQRLSSGLGGGAVDTSNMERLIDSQHNYIAKSVKELETRVLKALEMESGQLTKQGQDELTAIRQSVDQLVKEIRANNIFADLDKGEQSIVQEIRKGMEFNIAINKNLPLLFDLLKETIRLLREQNQLLRQK
jgi:hypothetical protein